MEPKALNAHTMDNNAINLILARLEIMSRDMARLNIGFEKLDTDVASMSGRLERESDPEAYLVWESSCNKIFQFNDLIEEKKSCYAIAYFERHELLVKLYNLRQGSKSVMAYYDEFQQLILKVDHRGNDEFHWVLAGVVLKERRIRVYDSMSRRRRSEPSPEIQKLAKILPTYLDMSGFLDQKVRTDWSMIEVYLDKMGNPFDVQYVEGIAQQTIDSLDYGIFVAAYVEYLSDGLQVPKNELDAGLPHKIYAALL
ncbi:hypothetical protein BC332_02359 [Capsicum chinense]|nr:hypothetical protein BC332_02359 [Capsicum chinense]